MGISFHPPSKFPLILGEPLPSSPTLKSLKNELIQKSSNSRNSFPMITAPPAMQLQVSHVLFRVVKDRLAMHWTAVKSRMRPLTATGYHVPKENIYISFSYSFASEPSYHKLAKLVNI